MPAGYGRGGLDRFMRSTGGAGRARPFMAGGRRPARTAEVDILDDEDDEGGPAQGTNNPQAAEDDKDAGWETAGAFDFQ